MWIGELYHCLKVGHEKHTIIDTSTAPSAKKIGIVPLIAASAMFMENLDATVIVTALPAMAATFGTTATSVSIGISSYMLAIAVVIPLSGWLTERVGTRNLLCGAIAAFTLASVLCGLCDTLLGFTLCRLAQGASAALMTPVARLVVVRSTEKTDLMHAIAIITWPALIAPILGPPLGGFLTTHTSWRWIFFMNVPIGLLGIAMTLKFVAQHIETERRAFDFVGYVLIASALATLMLGLQMASDQQGHWALAVTLVLTGIVLCTAALWQIKRSPNSLFDATILNIKTFTTSSFSGGFFSRLAISAAPFLLPLLFQLALGMSAFMSGLMMLAYFIGNIGMKLVTTRIVRGWGFRTVLLVNGLALAASVALCATLQPSSVTLIVITTLLIGGACRSLQMTALNSISFADVPAAQTGGANMVASLTQQVASATSIALAAGLLQASLALRDGSGLSIHDFQIAFVGMGALALIALPSYATLSHDAGAHVSGHRRHSG